MVVTQEQGEDAGSWPKGVGAITLFVDDLEATKRFYMEVFGLPVTFEAGELAAELAQVLAECRAAGAVSYEETLRYLADQGQMSADELHARAELLRRAMA